MTEEEYKKMSYNEKIEYLESLTDKEVQELYEKRNKNYKEIYNTELQSYDEYKEKYPKMEGDKCFVNYCKNKAIYKVGDERFWCGMCESCARIKSDYMIALKHNPKSLEKIPNNLICEW